MRQLTDNPGALYQALRMLTRIEIDGFKSFEELDVSLAPFTAIVGTNAAGKSNLFDAIQLLAALATHDVAEALKLLRGEPLELFRCTPQGRSDRITMAAEVLVDPVVRDPWGKEVHLNHTRIRYEVSLELRETRPGVHRVQVAHEAVLPIRPGADPWADTMRPGKAFRANHLKYKRTKPWLTTVVDRPEGPVFEIHQDGNQGRNRTRPASSAEGTVLYSITNAEFPHLFALREEMRHWRLLQLDPALLRDPSPVGAPDALSPDGANLAAVLARLKAETADVTRPQGVLDDIAADLNALIPGVARLQADADKGGREYRVELTMRDGMPFSSRVVSDGTLRVLALLTLLHDPRHRGMVCFEEPENGVHPGRVKDLVRRLRDMVSAFDDDTQSATPQPLSQLLLNSHSPVVLAALVDGQRHAVGGAVLFADTAAVVEPGASFARRRTRLRPVQPAQLDLFAGPDATPAYVSDYEVRRVLDTVEADG
jgi:predicted ATPase